MLRAFDSFFSAVMGLQYTLLEGSSIALSLCNLGRNKTMDRMHLRNGSLFGMSLELYILVKCILKSGYILFFSSRANIHLICPKES